MVIPFGVQNSSRVQVRPLTSFASTSQLEQGETFLSVTRNFRNDGPVPLLVALIPQHPDVSVNPAYVWLSPGKVERVHLEGPAEALPFLFIGARLMRGERVSARRNRRLRLRRRYG